MSSWFTGCCSCTNDVKKDLGRYESNGPAPRSQPSGPRHLYKTCPKCGKAVDPNRPNNCCADASSPARSAPQSQVSSSRRPVEASQVTPSFGAPTRVEPRSPNHDYSKNNYNQDSFAPHQGFQKQQSKDLDNDNFSRADNAYEARYLADQPNWNERAGARREQDRGQYAEHADKSPSSFAVSQPVSVKSGPKEFKNKSAGTGFSWWCCNQSKGEEHNVTVDRNSSRRADSLQSFSMARGGSNQQLNKGNDSVASVPASRRSPAPQNGGLSPVAEDRTPEKKSATVESGEKYALWQDGPTPEGKNRKQFNHSYTKDTRFGEQPNREQDAEVSEAKAAGASNERKFRERDGVFVMEQDDDAERQSIFSDNGYYTEQQATKARAERNAALKEEKKVQIDAEQPKRAVPAINMKSQPSRMKSQFSAMDDVFADEDAEEDAEEK